MKKVWEFIKKHKKMIIILVIVIVLAIGGIYIANLVKKTKGLLAGMGNSATTEEIERRDIVNSVTATGTIVAVDKRTVSSTVTGVKIKQLNVKVGDQVKAGDIICLLDGEDLEQQLADAQTMLNADAGRSGLDVASSNRGLNEALTSRDIDATRAEEDKNTAYHHAQDAGNEALEAENAYKDAASETKAYKDKMDAAAAALEKAKKAKDPDTSAVVDAAEKQKNDAETDVANAESNILKAKTEYESTADQSYTVIVSVAGTDISPLFDSSYLKDKIESISSVVVSDIYIGNESDKWEQIETRIDELKIKGQAYTEAVTSHKEAVK